ncbi:hypothetical protein AG1IA_06263 [Rhizoctonia solani AG-1 IA]|uniref:Defective in cullin neddylation protein n=1 Tax=Thanatephorus cucumeris (strain AG1-IA) TaxID=983506 RepID=L8WTM6_THACA|nr:hypothetical protein AG1IA_06263 [Rhizoctonia solani AG-1 IA]
MDKKRVHRRLETIGVRFLILIFLDDPEKRNGPILLGGTEMTCTPSHFEAETKIPPRIFLQRNPVGYVCAVMTLAYTFFAPNAGGIHLYLYFCQGRGREEYMYVYFLDDLIGVHSIDSVPLRIHSILRMAIESAIAFWNLLLSVGLSGSALPKNGWTDEHTEWWFEFLKERGGKGVSKDTWAMLPEFIKVIDGKFENHDLEAAWPSTIDDFVEWAKEKTQAGQS